jgi:hypothetical protein
VAQQVCSVLISRDAVPDPKKREALSSALSSLLRAAHDGPWEAWLEPTEVSGAPHLWVLRLVCPGRAMIVPILSHRQTIDGVLKTALESVSVADPVGRAS